VLHHRRTALNLAQTEFEVRTAMHAVGGVLLEQLLNSEPGQRGPTIACGGGHDAEFVSYRDKQLMTVLGPVRVRRAYYHCAACSAGLSPKDQELDVVGTSFTPGARRLMARVGAQEAFAAGQADLAELAGLAVSTKEVERVSEQCGAQIEVATTVERAAVMEGKVVALGSVPVLYVAIDGTGVPVLAREVAGRAGKDGPAKTREVKLACVFTQSTVDAQGYAVRDPGSSTYVGAIETAADFARRAKAEAVRRGLHRAAQVVVLGDGAPWIWTLATAQFPEAVHIVDLYHAREHLAGLGKLVYGAETAAAKDWIAARFKDLDDGAVDAVVHAFGCLPTQSDAAREQVRKETEYFETNALRMCYRAFRALGLFVGSGAVEAGCKTVVGQRLKHSGMRWSVKGANAVIALRCNLLSNRWEDFWDKRAAA
jgi:hypothetical protein